ncbi:MAG: DUF1565 domain-containing protein, partial [bacterium]|nr:DUF1565 domain-containing protein [bacterium]
PDCADDPDGGLVGGPPHQRFPGNFEVTGDGIDQDCDGEDLVPSNGNGVFVSANRGLDTNAGTMTDPVQTIGKGIEKALESATPKIVFVAVGDYDESVETSVSMYGDFDAGTWARPVGSDSSNINGQGAFAVKIVTGELTIDGFTISGPVNTDVHDVVQIENATVNLTNNTISGGPNTDYAADGRADVRIRGVYATGADVTMINTEVSGG